MDRWKEGQYVISFIVAMVWAVLAILPYFLHLEPSQLELAKASQQGAIGALGIVIGWWLPRA